MSVDYWVIDQISGVKCKRSDCVFNWKGQLVHRRNFETRQPQDIIKLPQDDPAVKDPRPRGPERYPIITANDL